MWYLYKIIISDEPRFSGDKHSLWDSRFSKEIRFSFRHLGRDESSKSAQVSAATTAIPLNKFSKSSVT